MLRELKKGESWSVKEMQKEQLYFETDSGVSPIVHHGTDKPYYAEELAMAIYKNELVELEKWRNQQHGRKSILNDEQKNLIHDLKIRKISNREIAKRLGVSEGTIRNHLKNMRK